MGDCRLSHACDKSQERDGPGLSTLGPTMATPNTALLPTRLVHIELLGVQLKARLVESKDLEDPIEYYTLSHCWGIVPFLTLRRHNYRSFKRDIHISRLSKTFQDSLIAAHRLGFQYVWIDSLCIIRKDPDDWGREANMMSSVYAGSSLNLPATSSCDGSGGLFFNRRLSTVRSCYVKLPSLGFNSFSCNPGGYNIVVFIKPPRREKEIDDSPLAQRGWVFQERFLAPRTLHSGASQRFWECKRGIVCETIPREQAFLSNTSIWFEHMLNGQDLFRAVPQATWGNIIRAYSKALLTREEDKIVALTGIAKYFYVLMNDEYLARLWRKGLEGQLLWSVKRRKACSEDKIPEPTRPTHYRALTWSWASVDGHICPGSWNTLPCENMPIRILNTKIDPVVPGCKFGQIWANFVRVSSARMWTTETMQSFWE
jgi:hypothetical protein